MTEPRTVDDVIQLLKDGPFTFQRAELAIRLAHNLAVIEGHTRIIDHAKEQLAILQANKSA